MTILINLHIRTANLHVIMFGYIMYVRFGCLNAILNKRMGQLISKAFKIFRREDTSMSASFVKRSKVEPELNAKIHNAKNIIILNAPVKRKYIWSS